MKKSQKYLKLEILRKENSRIPGRLGTLKATKVNIWLTFQNLGEKYSNSHNSYDNTGDSEDQEMHSPDRLDRNMHKGYNSTNGNGDFLKVEFSTESKINKDRSQENITFNTKGLPMRQKTLKRVEQAAKVDKNKNQTINQSKLPPSIRWVSTDDDPDPDFFNKIEKNYERNPKAIAQLAPLSSNHRLDGSTHDWKSGIVTEPNEARVSMNELVVKKRGKLKPLRE